jgi:hypothetical protein
MLICRLPLSTLSRRETNHPGPSCKSLTLRSVRLESCKKLQVFFARSSGLTDQDVHQMTNVLKAGAAVKILDISSNRSLTS